LNFIIPYSVLFNKDPDFDFLKKNWMCLFSFLKLNHSHKLDFIFQEGIFQGYSQIHKGYKCLSSSGRVYISKDVRFNEHEFPYSRLFPNTLNNIKDLNEYFNLKPILTPPLASNKGCLIQ